MLKFDGSMAEWFKALALHLWEPEFASRSLHEGFIVDESESLQAFPCHRFHSTIFSILTSSTISSVPVLARSSGQPTSCFNTHLKFGASSHLIYN